MGIVKTKEYDILFEGTLKERKLYKVIYKWIRKYSKDKQFAREEARKLLEEYTKGEDISKSKNIINIRLYFDKSKNIYRLWV